MIKNTSSITNYTYVYIKIVLYGRNKYSKYFRITTKLCGAFLPYNNISKP